MKGIILVLLILTQIGCSKSHNTENIIPIPNGDFENWDNFPRLLNWQTNSCPICTPAFETYIVLKDANAYRGQFAAKFIYNNVYSSWANNNFAVSEHPSTLTAYVKCYLASSDTVRVKINLH